MRFDPTQTVLAGVPAGTMVQWLSAAQTALNLLYTGAKTVTAAYDGKSVTYTEAEVGKLEAWIGLLQRQLGINRGRRALTPVFR
jgi:gpW